MINMMFGLKEKKRKLDTKDQKFCSEEEMFAYPCHRFFQNWKNFESIAEERKKNHIIKWNWSTSCLPRLVLELFYP